MMNCAEHCLDSLDGLRAFVRRTLCDHEQLAPEASPITERLLHRNGRPCAVQFCLHGPRSVMLTAIFGIDDRSVLFYNSAGERFQRVRLTDRFSRISIEDQAA